MTVSISYNFEIANHVQHCADIPINDNYFIKCEVERQSAPVFNKISHTCFGLIGFFNNEFYYIGRGDI